MNTDKINTKLFTLLLFLEGFLSKLVLDKKTKEAIKGKFAEIMADFPQLFLPHLSSIKLYQSYIKVRLKLW